MEDDMKLTGLLDFANSYPSHQRHLFRIKVKGCRLGSRSRVKINLYIFY
jgi:hypothetical protein